MRSIVIPDGGLVILRDSWHCRGERLAIGYWHSSHEPDLPDPADFVDPAWDPAERAFVIAYLETAEKVEQWRGYSACRICGRLNGSGCHGDARYNWPEGFAHYLRDHGVRPSDEFIEHVLATRS